MTNTTLSSAHYIISETYSVSPETYSRIINDLGIRFEKKLNEIANSDEIKRINEKPLSDDTDEANELRKNIFKMYTSVIEEYIKLCPSIEERNCASHVFGSMLTTYVNRVICINVMAETIDEAWLLPEGRSGEIWKNINGAVFEIIDAIKQNPKIDFETSLLKYCTMLCSEVASNKQETAYVIFSIGKILGNYDRQCQMVEKELLNSQKGTMIVDTVEVPIVKQKADA